MTAVETRWIDRRSVDLLVAWAWLPFFVVSLLLDGDALVEWTGVVLLISFAHQPLTLPLVYGDRAQFARRRWLYLVAPPVMVGAIYAAGRVSLIGLAVIALTWNAVHTIRQRYGLIRMYGRKVGQTDGRHEQALLFAAYLGVLSLAASQGTVTSRLSELPIGRVNRSAVDTVADLRMVATAISVVCAVWFVASLVAWVRLERSRPGNRAKHHYLAAAAVMCIALPFDPIAGLLAFAGAHAVEYAVVVHQNVGVRFGADAGPLESAISTRCGRLGFLACYTAVLVGSLAVIRPYVPVDVYVAVYLGFGGLHFLYDGLIWRSERKPQPAVSASSNATSFLGATTR